MKVKTDELYYVDFKPLPAGQYYRDVIVKANGCCIDLIIDGFNVVDTRKPHNFLHLLTTGNSDKIVLSAGFKTKEEAVLFKLTYGGL